MPPESLFHGECSTMSDVLVASFDLFRFGFRTSSYLFPCKPYIIIMPENIFPLHCAMVELILKVSFIWFTLSKGPWHFIGVVLAAK